ncbi:unnamed protein product, partial [Ascophyllum nodosum]
RCRDPVPRRSVYLHGLYRVRAHLVGGRWEIGVGKRVKAEKRRNRGSIGAAAPRRPARWLSPAPTCHSTATASATPSLPLPRATAPCRTTRSRQGGTARRPSPPASRRAVRG